MTDSQKNINALGISKAPKDTRVVVAMSGGVDSSVVAALLKEQGYEVIGITLQLYDHGEMINKKGSCCAGQDIHDARRVAETLNIPHYVLNYESKFKESVMDDFVETYLAGETPIPCVKCNQSVKFKDLLQTAQELGADVMATGHYVQRKESNGASQLHMAADPNRDQSYFLFATTKDQLDFLRFPLGHLENKAQTRELAARYGLQVADKPDSQDICFVPTGGYASVIEKLRPGAMEPGLIMHVDGYKLGEHNGIINYTVGQRRGLGIGGGDPLYVVRLDPDNKHVYVGPKEALLKKALIIRDVNWLDAQAPNPDQIVKVRLRSTQLGVDAKVTLLKGGRARVELIEPQPAISPGQACVAYLGARVLGGGWITAELAA